MVRFAITVWGKRISPVFDSASKFLLIDVKDGHEIRRKVEDISFIHRDDITSRIQKILSWHLHLVICSAISRPFAQLLESAGIELAPWISGDVEKVLEIFLNGKKLSEEFFMPGCRSRGNVFQCCQRNQKRKRGR